uniref:Vascular endothelial growth factor A n=1 Tax=Culex pipiens TaxID=7175 RepID=A0A8D8PHH4_CULPI
MQPIQVRASCLALLALIGGAAWGYENGGDAYGRAFRPSGLENSNNRMVRPLTNEKNRYSVISKDVKREVDAGDGCCRADDLPLDLALQLGNLTAAEDIFDFIDPDSIDQRIFASKDFGERSGANIPKPAGCSTTDTIVPLRPKDVTDPTLIYSPECTRVKRCSGCCVSSRLACLPTATRTIPFTVTVLEYKTGTKLKFKNRDVTLVEEHVSCQCQCRVREEHCNHLQRYNAPNCRCECTNPDDRTRCLQESDIKQWNPDTCLCECNEVKECTTGTYFDRNYCRCLKSYPPRGNFQTTPLDRRRLILKPVPAALSP